MTTPTKKEAIKITKRQLRQWLDRNSDPGTLPCIPVILINSLSGDKPGITLNMVPELTLHQVIGILKASVAQVEARLKELEGN